MLSRIKPIWECGIVCIWNENATKPRWVQWLTNLEGLFDDQATGRAKGVYLAIVTDDAAFGGE